MNLKVLKNNKTQLALVIFAGIQFLLFQTYAFRNVIDAIPRNTDQSVFLRISYHIYEALVAGDYREAFSYALNNLGQGGYAGLCTLLLFLLGNNRFSLLLANFFCLLLSEVMGFFCLKRISGKNFVGWMFIGLYLMSNTAFFEAGDLLDYRIDFAASCMYTCWSCSFLLFRDTGSKKYGYLSAVFMGILILFRLNTIVYLGVAIVLFEVGRWFIFQGREQWKELKHEIKYLFKYAMVVFVSGGWYLLIQLKNFINYYVTAHVQGEEPLIRALEQGVTNLFQNLMFYPKMVYENHLGKNLSILIVIIVIVICGLLLYKKKIDGIDISKKERASLWFMLCAIISPIIVLTVDLSKSAVVIGIITGSIVAFVCYLTTLAFSRLILQRMLVVLSVVCLSLGAVNYMKNTTTMHQGYDKETQNILLEINKTVADYIVDNQLNNPLLLLDRTTDGVTIDTVTTYLYESEKVFIELGYATSMGVASEFTESDILEGLEKADVVIISPKSYSDKTGYITDESFDEYRGLMWNYATENMHLLNTVIWGNDLIAIFGKNAEK